MTLFLLAYHILKPFPHIDTEYLSQNLVKITYCAAQQNDFLKLNVLGHFIFSSTYQKQLSSNYGTQSSPVSILDTYASAFLSSKASYRIKSLALIFSLQVKTSPASFLKSSARKSMAWGLYPRHPRRAPKGWNRDPLLSSPLLQPIAGSTTGWKVKKFTQRALSRKEV